MLILVSALRLNQLGHTRLASYTFLILLIAGTSALSLFESAARLTLLYLMPIVAASFLLSSRDSFLFAALATAGYALAFKARPDVTEFNYFVIIGFFLLALLAWQVATSLDSALRKVRLHAEELDHRVAEQTLDLRNALEREHVEASKVQAILQSMNEGVIVFDHNEQAILANPGACSLLECDEEDVIGGDLMTVLGSAIGQEEQALIRVLREGSRLWRASLKAAREGRTLIVSFAPVELTSSNEPGTVVVLRDMTKEAEVEQMKSEFMSLVSRELYTSMSAVRGYVDLLTSGAAGAITEMQYDFLQIAKTHADRLGSVIGNISDLARIETGEASLHFEAVSLRNTLLRAAQDLSVDDRGLSLDLDIPQDLPDVLADASRLGQIITHLLSNALKHTLEGRVGVAARVVGDQAQVDVTDTGIGITEHDQAKLFTGFFRTSNARALDIPGVGLGLALTHALVEMHGGRIWVRSTVGRGSTFSFTIPLFPKPLTSAPAPDISLAEMEQDHAKRFKILVVDDELSVAQSMRQPLEAKGFDVLITTKAARALPIAEHEQPHLILLDVIMPEMDGFEVLQQLKQNPTTLSIPVLLTSTIPEREAGLGLGASGFLTKPIREDQLLSSVQRVLVQPKKVSLSVLVVDDDPGMRRWLSLVLSGQGISVFEAQDSELALATIATHQPNLILLGLELTTKDGWRVIRKTKQSPQTASIPIILLTASRMNLLYDRAHVLGMGIQQILAKPVSAGVLVREIKRQLAI